MIYLITSTNTATNFAPSVALLRDGIMVIEDCAVQRNAVVNFLRRFNIERIYESDNGSKALSFLGEMDRPPAALILDLELPGKDGIEVLQELALANIRPAIIIASSVDEALIGSVAAMIEALHFPLLGAFRKPCEPMDLLESLRRLDFQEVSSKRQPTQLVELKAEYLTNAIVNGEIKPHYQPKIDLKNGNIAGFEALARWRLSGRQQVSPAIFIPMAEKLDLISDLTLCIFDQVLRDMVMWREQGLTTPVAINLSAKSLGDRQLVAEIINRVQKHDIPPELITFEITESALVVDLAEALGNTSRLRLRGFCFSIDDYGTGFSSMQQLTRFPFSELKIDRSFVHGSSRREHLRNIVQSAVDMGERLNIVTVAEGVETENELRLLKNMGCCHAQGFYIAKPMAGEDVIPWSRQELQIVAEICNSD